MSICVFCYTKKSMILNKGISPVSWRSNDFFIVLLFLMTSEKYKKIKNENQKILTRMAMV